MATEATTTFNHGGSQQSNNRRENLDTHHSKCNLHAIKEVALEATLRGTIEASRVSIMTYMVDGKGFDQ